MRQFLACNPYYHQRQPQRTPSELRFSACAWFWICRSMYKRESNLQSRRSAIAVAVAVVVAVAALWLSLLSWQLIMWRLLYHQRSMTLAWLLKAQRAPTTSEKVNNIRESSTKQIWMQSICKFWLQRVPSYSTAKSFFTDFMYTKWKFGCFLWKFSSWHSNFHITYIFSSAGS